MLLPKVLPNETLHSRMCRFLAINAMNGAAFTEFVFADRKASIHPYLNGNLEALSACSTEPSKHLWQYQTLAPLFAHFLPEHREKIRDLSLNSEEIIRTCQVALFKQREGILVKYCPFCAQEDIKNYGVAYWHLEHQITGVEACYKHNVWLVKKQLHGRMRISGSLIPSTATNLTAACTETSSQFAKYTQDILERIQLGKLPIFIDHADLLKQKGFLTQNNQIRQKGIFPQLNQLCFELFNENSPLLPKGIDDYKYWMKVIYGRSQPPFKHLILDFLLNQLPDIEKHPIQPISPVISDELKNKCIELLIEGLTLSEISRRTGKSCCYLSSLAKAENIDFGYKPKLLTKDVVTVVVSMAWKGFHRRVMAKKFNVSTGSIEQIISSVDGLVDWRKRCKYESKRRRHKLTLLRYCKANPTAIRKNIKKDCNAAFFWFYLYEREWLEDFLPTARKPYENALLVDWESRDRELALQIQEMLDKQTEPIYRAEIERRFHVRGLFAKHKQQLPKTMSVIEKSQMIKRYSKFATK